VIFKPGYNVLRAYSLYFIAAIICLAMVWIAIKKPVGDFGNYYYGSKILLDGKIIGQLYTDTHWFNEQIKTYGEKDVFGNYIPVPPFSLVFYSPLTFFSANVAKLIFNLFSILLFGISLSRFLKTMPALSLYLPAAFAALFFALYRNFLEGQSYLIITACLLEVYLSYIKKRYFLIAFYISILFHLKLFPVFILGYFLFRKEYKVVLLSFLMMIVLGLLTFFVAGKDVVVNYYTDIVPRLFRNEIVDPFYYGHQGLNIFLNGLFNYDELSNPSPLFYSPLLVKILQGVVTGIVIYTSYLLVKKTNDFRMYAFFIFSGILISGYVTSYALLLLLPFAFTVFDYKKSVFIFILLLVSCNLPLASLADAPVFLKYSRIMMMFAVFIFALAELKPGYRILQLTFVCSCIVLTGMITPVKAENFYYKGTGKYGIDYDFSFYGNKIILNTCFGSTDLSDTLEFVTEIKTLSSINVIQAAEKYRNFFKNKGNVKKAALVNDTTLLYLSDVNRGVGMSKLRIIRNFK